LSEYLDGTLSRRAAARVETHVESCAACRSELAELRRTRELLRSLRGRDEAPDLAGAVLARIRAGEAAPSAFERVRAAASRLLGSWGAPLATAAVGLAVLALVPRIEIEVRIPGGAEPAPEAAPRAEASAPALRREATPPVFALRVNEGLRRDLEAPAPFPMPLACLDHPSFEACRDESQSLMDFAQREPAAFVERVEAVPSTQRERLIGVLSRHAAESGAAASVAARLRETGDPRARRLAQRFEGPRFDGR
jgi:hypothetical protein